MESTNTPTTRRAYWRHDGDDLIRGDYRITGPAGNRVVTFKGTKIGEAATLIAAKQTVNAHEDGQR